MSDLPGPVSRLLEADVRREVAEGNLIIWLDADGHYREFVERLIEQRKRGELNYEVYRFRGSHLELMLDLEEVLGGFDATRAIIHLPGFNEELIKTTPLFEVYRAGKRYRKALETLIRETAVGKVRPDQIDAYLQRGNLSVADADQWLNDLLSTGTEGLASQLRNVSLIELVDDLLFQRTLARRIAALDFGTAANVGPSGSNDQLALQDRIVALCGMPEAWLNESLQNSYSSGQEATSAEAVAYAICSWAACVSYVHDLRESVAPRSAMLEPVRRLPLPVRQASHELVVHLQQGNDRQRSFYRQTAIETESRLGDDVGQIAAEDLGRFDTFYFEEVTILQASIQALLEKRWDTTSEWAERRRREPDSFWLRDDPLRRNTWQLISAAARLGVAIQVAGPELAKKQSLADAVEEYVRVGAEVDQAHRQLEQDRHKLLRSQLPEFEKLRSALDQMQLVWRDWANAWGRGFNAVCSSHGFLPDSTLQQRTLFDDVVKPLTAGEGTTAYFVIDALRYEMGQELLAAFEEAAQSEVQLAWRLAELPTVTEVGMNVLSPVAKLGKLQPELVGSKIVGFSAGEYRVNDPDTRRRAMHDRIGGRTCPRIELAEVLRLESRTLQRKIAGARLVMVHSREIDSSGEAGFGPAVFETVLKDLRSAWHLLREAGVRNFVFTADHGFLLVDEESRLVQTHGRKVDPHRRHVISDRAANHNGEVRVPLRDLGYSCDDLQLMFPEGVAVFDTGKQRKGFAHGGNSFQERVIPVLTVAHRIAAGGSTTAYALFAEPKAGVGDMHCLSARVDNVAGTIDFGSYYEVDLGLRVPEAPDVRAEVCSVRDGARLVSGTVIASVGKPFEVFFRLTGSTESRVQVELYHPSREVRLEPCTLKERFDVLGVNAGPVTLPTEAWLNDLPAGAVRRVFQHLAHHGVVTENEVADMLGSAREQRKFSVNFERLAACVPFKVRIDVVAGVKRYVREGATS